MNVWTEPLKRGDKVEVGNGGGKFNRIFVTYIEGAISPYVCVSFGREENFHNGEQFSITLWKYAQRIIEPEYRPLTSQEMKELVGKKIKKKNEIRDVTWFTLHSSGRYCIVLDSGVQVTPKELLQDYTYYNGTPCGVEVEVC